MNYMKCYKKIVRKAKNEKRVKNQQTYYEKHHIIPDFMFYNRKRKGPRGHLTGDPNCKDNIILLTPREHFLCHVLLAKALKSTHYGYQAASALAFFYNKVVGNHKRQTSDNNIAASKKYEVYRKIGLKGISESRKGKIPVMDAITRESIGSVPVNHENVINGKWVHVTKGRVISQEELKRRKPISGNNNPNYKEMTEERKQRLFDLVERSTEDRYLKINVLQSLMKEEFVEFKKISTVWLLHNFGTYQDFIKLYNKERATCVQYDPYHRSTKQRKLCANVTI